MRPAATAAATGPPLLLMWWKRGRRLHLQDGHGSGLQNTGNETFFGNADDDANTPRPQEGSHVRSEHATMH